ncbi:MAG: uracil-DNA glycosylase family protein [Amylibacter sp.]
MTDALKTLQTNITSCTLCADRFAATKTAHSPRPVAWLSATAPILIAGQAPGARVQISGRPFTDPSGDRLRDWLGVDETVFYDRNKFAVLPMAFCFPGYDAKGSDLPPPKICADTWRDMAMTNMPQIKLTLLIGAYAQKWHLPKTKKLSVTARVENWRDHAPAIFPLPHPSWRNSGWLKQNPWFETDLLPALQSHVASLLKD